MYPENPEGTQVILGSMNMGYDNDISLGIILIHLRFGSVFSDTWLILEQQMHVLLNLLSLLYKFQNGTKKIAVSRRRTGRQEGIENALPFIISLQLGPSAPWKRGATVHGSMIYIALLIFSGSLRNWQHQWISNTWLHDITSTGSSIMRLKQL